MTEAEKKLTALSGLLAPDLALPTASHVADMPDWPGAYALLIAVDRARPFGRGAKTGTVAPGWHIYAGSAYGPGGVRARLKRHFDPEKRPHWHVDGLTVGAASLAALAFRNGNECALVAKLRAVSCFAVEAPGFGGSDCRRCPAHLLAWRDERCVP